MSHRKEISFRVLTPAMISLLVTLLVATQAWAVGRFGQLVLEFPGKRTYSYSYDEGQHSLVLDFRGTTPAELGALERYDERLIKRALVKDLGSAGVEVRLFLKDRSVQATVSDFQEPFRVVIDMYDQKYKEAQDPVTGLPMIAQSEKDMGEGASMAGQLVQAPALDKARENTTAASDSDMATARRLMQPSPVVFESTADLSRTLDTISAGPGKSWDTYPPMIYRVQTAAYTGELAGREPMLPSSVSSTRAMAAYAGGLYDYGHEGRALIVYNQVLHREPQIFDNEPLHLWRLAEIHLGQGNLTLASGYYLALLEKHPTSALARFATMRRLDVEAIYATRKRDAATLESLLNRLVAIDPSGNAELKAQIALRYAFWKKAQGQFEAGYMPSLDTSARAWLTSARGGLESKRTAFWVDTLLLSDMIRPDSAWSKDAAKATAQYLSRYSDKTAEPYRTSLENQAKARVSAAIREATDKAAWTETVAIWEGLTGSLRSIGEAAPISWAMAESYRQMGHHDKASEFYRRAAKGFETAPERFRASFWESVTASTAAESRQDLRGRDAEFTSWDDHARLADQQTLAQWNTLEPSQKTEMYAVLREPLEKQATGLALLKAPPQIVLEMWSGALNTETSVVGGEPSSATSKGFQGPRSVTLLTELRSKLEKIGMHDQAKAARDLLKKLDAKELAADKAARRVWGEEISALAEEERQASNYLEAGKLYGVVGSEGVAAEGKASALYKSGLLLYRAGRRQEAIEALRKASEDQNDLHYAELAKQRLSQLEK